MDLLICLFSISPCEIGVASPIMGFTVRQSDRNTRRRFLLCLMGCPCACGGMAGHLPAAQPCDERLQQRVLVNNLIEFVGGVWGAEKRHLSFQFLLGSSPGVVPCSPGASGGWAGTVLMKRSPVMFICSSRGNE